MRLRLAFIATAVLLAVGGQVMSMQAEESAKPGIDLTFEVPQGEAPQIVNVVTRDIAPGGAIPWHTHPGVEIAYVESGRLELEMAGRDKQLLEPGNHFMVPRGVVHAGRNVGDQPARLVLTYVVDKDAPLRSPAEPPHEGHESEK